MTVNFEGLTMNQLAERNAELVTEISKANELLGNTGFMTLSELITLTMSEKDKQISELQRKVEALAVENVAFKAFGGTLNEMHNDLNGEGTVIQGRSEIACQQIGIEAAMDAFDEIKSPATDAAIAEIEARGVEYVADRIDLLDERMLVSSTSIREYAAQLRAGEVSNG